LGKSIDEPAIINQMIKVILQYLYDIGGLSLVNQALRDQQSPDMGEFALDEVAIRMSEEQIKKYAPDWTPDGYREWFRKRRRSWKQEWIDRELFE